MWTEASPTPAKRLAGAIQNAFSDPQQVVLIMLGAGINLTLGFGLAISSLSALIASSFGVLLTGEISSQVFVLAISYFLTGSVYSTVASLTLRPKRIVNPLFIQVITASFVSILAFYLVVVLKPSITFLNASAFAFVIFLLALVYSFLQAWDNFSW